MGSKYDVTIVGGGAMGSSIACHLAMEPGFAGSIAVIERDPTYATASSALSASSIRQQFSTPENIALSRWSLDFLRHIGDRLAVDGDRPSVGLREQGYLFLATEAGMPVLRANHGVQTAAGADVALLGPAALKARFPWLNVADLAGGALGLSGEGWFDGWSLLQAFRRKAISLGVTYVTGEVTGLEREAGRIVATRLADGTRIGCGATVNAAGPWAGRVAAMAGADLPVSPRKRFVYVIECRTPVAGAPLLIDPTGVYFRPEGNGFICGTSPPEDDDRDCEDLEVEYELFESTVWPALAHRVPAFEAIRLSRAWAGHYEYNRLDQNGIIGPHPEIANLWFANGFSGHGIQQSPAVGRTIAEWIVYGAPRSLDVRRFGFDRIAANRPLREVNVV